MPAALASPAGADTVPTGTTPATVSADPLPTVQIDGVVWDQVVVGTTVYAVGSFSSARPAGSPPGQGETVRSNALAYDLRTGELLPSFAPGLNAQARTVAASPDGSTVYVGGSFTAIDGRPAYRLAAFSTATGKRITTFTAGTDGTVSALAVSAGSVYVGGSFASVNNQARLRLAAVNPTTGALQAWTAPVRNGGVAALLVSPDGSRVIVGGSFGSINGVETYGSASLDAQTGRSLPWAANQVVRNGGIPSGATYPVSGITSLSTDGRSIFASAYGFGTTGRPSLEGTFAAEPSTGAVRWINDCTGDTYATTTVGGVLYTVGHTHSCSAPGWFDNAPDTAGTLQHWHSLAYTTTDSGRNNVRPDQYGQDFTAYRTSSLLHWSPRWTAGTYTGQSQAGWSVESTGQFVVVGGEFLTVGGRAQQGLVRFAVKGSAPNAVGPRALNPAPLVANARGANGRAVVSMTTRATWDPDNADLTYRLVRDPGTSSATVVDTRTVGSSFWRLPLVAMGDANPPSDRRATYAVRVSDPLGVTTTSTPTTAATSGWAATSGQVSAAVGGYTATLGRATLSGRTLTVPFSAKGPGDLRRPEGTCLSDGTTSLTPVSTVLSADSAGAFAGSFTYRLPGPGTWTLQYSCGSVYTRAVVGTWTGLGVG